MSLVDQGTKLSALTTGLIRQWEQTRASWLDAKSEAFDQRTIEPLRTGIGEAVEAMQRLDPILRAIRRDCE